jgi:hypothetical protein
MGEHHVSLGLYPGNAPVAVVVAELRDKIAAGGAARGAV